MNFWNVDGQKGCIGSTRFCTRNKRPPRGYSWVDGRLTKTQVTSRSDTIQCGQRCGHPSPNVLKREASSNEKATNTSCTQEEEHSRCSSWRSPHRKKNFKKKKNPVEPNQQCHASMNILDAKTALDKEWSQLQKTTSVEYAKSYKSNEDAISEAKVNNRKVHLATLVDLCHFNHSGLAEHLRKNTKGTVVLRGDNVKDDTGGCAVFTEQGASASHMTAAVQIEEEDGPRGTHAADRSSVFRSYVT